MLFRCSWQRVATLIRLRGVRYAISSALVVLVKVLRLAVSQIVVRWLRAFAGIDVECRAPTSDLVVARMDCAGCRQGGSVQIEGFVERSMNSRALLKFIWDVKPATPTRRNLHDSRSLLPCSQDG